MAAPIKQVHVDQRRIRQLDDEDFFLGYRADGIDVDLSRQRMKAVEDKPDIGMIRPANNFPGVAMIIDISPPGKRLIANLEPPFGRTLTQFMKIGRGAIDTAESCLRHVRADKHHVRPEFLHDVELALGPVERPLPKPIRHALEITKGLKEGDFQTEVARHSADIGGASVKSQEVVLKNLHAVKTRPRNRFEFLRQFAAQRYRRNRGLHVPRPFPSAGPEPSTGRFAWGEKAPHGIMSNISDISIQLSKPKISYVL